MSFALPALPDKAYVGSQELPNYMRAHRDEYVASRARAGISMERIYLMFTPTGEFFVQYVEADRTLPEIIDTFVSSTDPFDKFFMGKVEEWSGIDFAVAPKDPSPELIAEWANPEVTVRAQGLAFVAPLRPGKTEAARAFAAEAFERRRDELAASRRRIGGTREAMFLNRTLIGDNVCVYLEGDDPVEENRRFARSQHPFDVWFKERCREIFPAVIDFNEPLPPIARTWEWQEGEAIELIGKRRVQQMLPLEQ